MPKSEQDKKHQEDLEKVSEKELVDVNIEALESGEPNEVIEVQMEESQELSEQVVATAEATKDVAEKKGGELTPDEQTKSSEYLIGMEQGRLEELRGQLEHASGMSKLALQERILKVESEVRELEAVADIDIEVVEPGKEGVIELKGEDFEVVEDGDEASGETVVEVSAAGGDEGPPESPEIPEGSEAEGESVPVTVETGETTHEFLSDADVKDMTKRLESAGFEGDVEKLLEDHGANAELHVLSVEVKHYRDEMAGLEAQMKKYEGVTGGVKKMINKEKFESDEAELAEMKSIYETVRAEYVGGKVEKYNEERMALADSRLEKASKEKGLGDYIKGAYKAMGDANLAALYDKRGWDKGGKIKTMMLKAASVRTLVASGLVGASFAVGGAAGLGMFAASRGIRGIGSSILAYDSMRGIANRERVMSVQSRLAGTKIGEKMGVTKETAELVERQEMEKMTNQEIVEYLDAAEARARTGGKLLSEDETYQKMSTFFAQKMEQHKETVTEGEDAEKSAETEAMMMANLNEMMLDSDRRQEELITKRESNKRAMKIAAVGIGMIMGTIGLGSKVEAFQDAKIAAAEAAVEEKSQATIAAAVENVAEQKSIAAEAAALIEAQKTPASLFQEVYGEKGEAMLEAARVDKGEGITHVIKDQLKVNAEEFGYNPKLHGGLDRWATLKSAEIARDNDMLHATNELRFKGVDPTNPDQFAFLTKTPDGELKIDIQGIETQVFNRPTELNFGGGDAGQWSANIEYSRNGLPKGFSFETTKLPSKDALAEAFGNSEELGARLANRGEITTLLSSEFGDTYQKMFARVHQEQELLEKLRSMGQGGSRASKMLESSVDRKLEILNNMSEGGAELVRFESADAGANIKAYAEVFTERGMHRQSLEQLVYSEEGVARIGMVDKAGETIMVDRSPQSIEAAWRELRSVRENIEAKSGLDFIHGGDEGAVTGFEQSGLLGMNKAVDELRLKPGFLDILKDEGLSNAERNRVDVLVRAIATEESAIKKLTDSGLGRTPEWGFLEDDVVGKHRELKNLIGDAEVWRQATQEQIEETAKLTRSLSLKIDWKPSLFDARAPLSEAAEAVENAGGASVAERTETLVASKLSPETLQQIATGEFNDGLVEVAPKGEVVVLDTTDPSTVEAAKAALEIRGSTVGGAELVSGDLGERAEALAEVAVDQTEIPASVPGVFRTLPNGEIRHMISNAEIQSVSMSDLEESVLQDNWQENIKPGGFFSPTQKAEQILGRARVLAVRQDALKQLGELGLSDSPQADALQRNIAMTTRLTEKMYGDVLQ